jgi:hypothetical protein
MDDQMSDLTKIKVATESLSLADKQELLLFLAASLRSARRQAPEPRLFVREQLAAWIEEDEADMQRFRDDA